MSRRTLKCRCSERKLEGSSCATVLTKREENDFKKGFRDELQVTRSLNGVGERWWEIQDALDSDLVCNYGPYSEILIVIWGLKCKGCWITAKS